MVTHDAILLGAGLGTRFAGDLAKQTSAVPKQFQILAGAPVFVHCLRSLLSQGCYRQIVFAAPKQYLSLATELVEKYIPAQRKTLVRIVAGGESRQQTSAIALEVLEELNPVPTRVLIHDACRPVLSREFLSRILACLNDRSYGAWVPVIPVVDTLKRVENDRVIETVDRGLVHRVQTPQIFEYTVIRGLAERAKTETAIQFTDDASLCEYFGIPVGVFEGDVKNIKLTYEFELQTLRTLLEEEHRKEPPCATESATTFTV